MIMDEDNEENEWKPGIGPMSHYFAAINRNTRSMKLNLKHEKGRQIFRDMVRTSDVVFVLSCGRLFGRDFAEFGLGLKAFDEEPWRTWAWDMNLCEREAMLEFWLHEVRQGEATDVLVL